MKIERYKDLLYLEALENDTRWNRFKCRVFHHKKKIHSSASHEKYKCIKCNRIFEEDFLGNTCNYIDYPEIKQQ